MEQQQTSLLVDGSVPAWCLATPGLRIKPSSSSSPAWDALRVCSQQDSARTIQNKMHALRLIQDLVVSPGVHDRPIQPGSALIAFTLSLEV